MPAPTLADSLRLLHLGPDVVERLTEKLYAAKLAEYRATLSELRSSYGGPARVYLSTEIRDALLNEAERDASSVAATYNRLIAAEGERSPLTGQALFDHLAAYARERGRVRSGMIARSAVAPARLDAAVSFYLENGIEPEFDFVGPAPKCVICKTLKATNPHTFAEVLAVGIPHIQCTHRWKGRVYSAAKLAAGGIRPGKISAGAGPPAGIVGAESLREKLAGLPEDEIARIISSGELAAMAKAAFDEAEHPRIPRGLPHAGEFTNLIAELDALSSAAEGAGDPEAAQRALSKVADGVFAQQAADAIAAFSHNPKASTMDVYGDGDRTITDPLRGAFHAAWARAAKAGVVPPAGRPPRAVLLIGGGGAGKGTLLRLGLIGEIGPKGTYVHADPDIAKVLTPEFLRMAGPDVPLPDRWPRASARVHEQSSVMNELVTDAALNEGLDLVYDKVGLSTNWNRRAREIVDRLGAENVTAHVVTTPVDDAIERANLRGIRSGRHVDEEEIRRAHARVAANWRTLRELGVKAAFWDNRSKPPKLIAELGANGKLRIFDQALWDEFQSRAGPHGS